jgi:hypothetical protein
MENDDDKKVTVKYSGIRHYPKHKENPFMKAALIKVGEHTVKKTRVQRSTNKAVINQVINQDGESVGYTSFMEYIELDDDKFTKVFTDYVGYLWDLGKPATRVLTFIQTQLIPHKDRFVFLVDKAEEFTKYKGKKLIYEGLGQLIDKEIIARTEREWEYFINPQIIFNGNRLTMAKTFIRKQKEEDKNQLKLFDFDNMPTERLSTSQMKTNSQTAIEKYNESLDTKEEDWSNFTGKEDIGSLENISKVTKLSVEEITEIMKKAIKSYVHDENNIPTGVR